MFSPSPTSPYDHSHVCLQLISFIDKIFGDPARLHRCHRLRDMVK
uniref:Uncharacterized protein n=1 Tax=Anguilla anguilla TaxID=7936 RepID=A0A0E9P704_ANGAN